MQLFSIIRQRAGDMSNQSLEIALGLVNIDDGQQHDGRYVRRYLSGESAMGPNDLQQVAQLALRKGLLRARDLPRGLGSSIEALVGERNVLLKDTLGRIQQERNRLVAARQCAIDAVSNLMVVQTSCQTAGIVHSLEEPSGEIVCGDGVGIDLIKIKAALDDCFVAVFAPKSLVDLVPDESADPAQIRHNRATKRNRKKSSEVA